MGQKTTAQDLREQLMAPRAIERIHAMHALELELEGAPSSAVAEELEAFTARGIPYYAPEDPDYREWVAKAVSYWERLHAGEQAGETARKAGAKGGQAIRKVKQQRAA